MGRVDEIHYRTKSINLHEIGKEPKSLVRQLTEDISHLIEIIEKQYLLTKEIDNGVIGLFIIHEKSQDPVMDFNHCIDQAKKLRLKIMKSLKEVGK